MERLDNSHEQELELDDSMRYFTDGSGHLVRVQTSASFGEEFSAAKVEAYSVKQHTWIEASGMTTEIRFSGDWVSCSVDEAKALL